jgi:hypothetical protein
MDIIMIHHIAMDQELLTAHVSNVRLKGFATPEHTMMRVFVMVLELLIVV